MKNNQQLYDTYRQTYREFVYDDFRYDVQSDGLHIAFFFHALSASGQRHTFRPTAFFPSRPFLHPGSVDKQLMDNLVFNIGMAELISYWKIFCPPVVVIKPFALDASQFAFWKKLYFNGLGEFFYTNGINATIDDFMTLRSESDGEDSCPPTMHAATRAVRQEMQSTNPIVPIGGGKDSVVTLELLGGTPLIMNPRGATVACIEKAGYRMDDVVEIHRRLDPLMLELNAQGALNGHTPFSAMLAFYTLLASAMMDGMPRIALSNESSANESTVAGTSVNHQYSKSLEFENDFRRYVSENISPDFNYFSFLRPLSELQIAMLFAQLTKYHDVFRSCNVGSKQDIWCGHCAKCLFAYIILSPFIAPDRLNAIFGKGMLDDLSLKLEFDQLIGRAATKPFECVGTVSEVNSALSMAIAKWYPAERPALLQGYVAMPPTTPLDTLFAEHNLLPDDLRKLQNAVKHGIGHSFLDEQLKSLFAEKEILIAGYGREGQSTHRLLQRLFPGRSFDVANDDHEACSMLRKKHYDLIMKSPGIPTMRFEGHCDLETLSSQTDIFLQLFGHHTIGISGTKGKSTTASLLYKVLKDNQASLNRNLGHDYNDVVLAGNIGIPLFDILPQLEAGSWVVAELSCHQLENIHRGPAIGLLLNFFEEHLDHYHNYADYCHAKLQMALRQQSGDTLYYCSDNDDLRRAISAATLSCSAVPYSLEEAASATFLDGSPLAGDHNRLNTYAVWLIAKQMGIDEASFQQSLMSFHPLEHRLERVACIDGVTYYNDSISTIPQATIAAIEALKEVDTLLLGGMDRGIDYAPLAQYLTRSALGLAVKNLVLVGGAGQSIERQLALAEPSMPWRCYRHFGSDYSMGEMVRFAASVTARGKVCLLSPAASSYDHYKNFQFRGSDFKCQVLSLRPS